MHQYDHTTIEQKWHKRWEEQNLHATPDVKDGVPNEMLLVEFPYPSGDLHVGHWYAFAIPDILARFKRMRGINVLYPIGFDAFGLPAENAAIKRGLNPRTWTEGNILSMKKQMALMGTSFDWGREVQTIDPAYYKWTQWLFIQLFNAGLVYQKETPANWCSSCKTILANEQVVNGHCERCGTEVEKKNMLQWNIKITDYAERLLSDLDTLDWPEPIKQAQREWIGKSEGALIQFPISDSQSSISVFTTRPDTLFGATYMVLAPEHPLVAQLKIKNRDEVDTYITQAKKKKDIERTAEGKEKTGVCLEGITAINPATKEEIPVFIADYVLAHYGTGAIMAVPAHDERDFAFATKFDLPIIQVIKSSEALPVANTGILMNSQKFDGLDSEEAKSTITEHVGGTMQNTYRLRDWGVSRQRYWGVPIPIVHCKTCGPIAVPDSQLPVQLPNIEDYLPAGDGRSPLAKVDNFVHTTCPKCGENATRETDTLDTFVDSSWYYLRYTDSKNEQEFATKEKQKKWMPVSLYSGGAEHTTMHLLYSRFWHKALFDLGLVADPEPYTRRMNRGIILGPDGNKMSKSKGNVINPDEVVERLGADTVRMYLAFIGPYNEPGHYPWNPDGVVGVRRFLERVWRLHAHIQTGTPSATTEQALHKAIKKVSDDAEQMKFNTAISALMIFLNGAEKSGITQPQYETLLRLLAPFAPHITEELWSVLGNTHSIHLQSWPICDTTLLFEDTVTLGIQVNGKRRGEVTVAHDATDDTIIQQAQAQAGKWLLDGYKKAIVVKGRLVNFVA